MGMIGFSTGALAKGDFRRALEMLRGYGDLRAVELSALRDHELEPLVDALPDFNLDAFEYVSVHAPSRLSRLSEDEVISALSHVPASWPIIVHPDIIETPVKWQSLGGRLCLENMDARKASGRTVAEMREWFAALPDARFCLDLGHARQIDPTMTVALQMLSEFGDRLTQLHVSEVGPDGEHLPIHALAALAFSRVVHRVPSRCAIIIESIVVPERMEREINTVRRLFFAASRSAA